MPLRSPGTTVARTDSEIVEAVEDSAVALAAGSTVGGTAIASTDDVRTDAEIVAAVEASATLDLDAGATIGGSAIVSDADLALVALDDLADVSASSPSDQDVLTWDDGSSTWVAQAGGGGLTGLTNVSTADYGGFTVDGTDDDLVLAPNGTGAIRARTDGNARGNYAICLVPRGLSANQVASGDRAVAIGDIARASGDESVAIGAEAEATGNGAVSIGNDATTPLGRSVSIGYSSVSGQSGVVIGNNAGENRQNGIAIGVQALAEQNSVALGSKADAARLSSVMINNSSTVRAPLTRDSMRVAVLHHVVELRASSPDATPVEATSDGAAAVTANSTGRNVVMLADGKVVGFLLSMTAIQDTTNDAAFYEIVGAAKCIAGTASIIGANSTIAKEDDAGWDCTVTTTGNRLVVTCTADAGGASTWRGTLTLTYED